MDLSDDKGDIIITDSHDLNEGPAHANIAIDEESGDASLRALESQGISLVVNEEYSFSSAQPHENFSKELLEEEGIEIISSGDED